MPGRKRYDALFDAVRDASLPTFVTRDGSFYLDPDFDGSAWETLKREADDIVDKAKNLKDHPHLHDSHKDKAGDLVTAAESFQGMVMNAYNECLRVTSHKHAPWYAVPADDKPNARLIVSQVLIETMAGLHSTFPRMNSAKRRELRAIRRSLGGG